MATKLEAAPLLEFIIDKVNVGVFVLDGEMRVVLWNHFMEMHSGRRADEVVGRNLFDAFPELPRTWLEKKIQSVHILKNFAFTTWEQRPYLFQFRHTRDITGGIDWMRQNCTFIPIKDASGKVELVCVTLLDVTDTAIYQGMMHDALARLDEASNRDGLTGIFNRRYLAQALSKEFVRVKRYTGDLSLLMIDLDNFKHINDERGHLAGDEVIRTTADTLRNGIREADTLGRYGGEEFVVILPQTRVDGAITLAERLRKGVEAQATRHGGVDIPVTISIGVAQMDPTSENYERLLQEADQALYRSKQDGRNRVSVFEPHTQSTAPT